MLKLCRDRGNLKWELFVSIQFPMCVQHYILLGLWVYSQLVVGMHQIQGSELQPFNPPANVAKMSSGCGSGYLWIYGDFVIPTYPDGTILLGTVMIDTAQSLWLTLSRTPSASRRGFFCTTLQCRGNRLGPVKLLGHWQLSLKGVNNTELLSKHLLILFQVVREHPWWQLSRCGCNREPV